ncbi:MAG: hypothetical protein LBR45_02495, partial [Bacteroidales bacterium]|nr:hypothetical protein [Bacteroidales bacterium]
GRQLFFQYIQDENYDKAIELYNYLNDKVSRYNCDAFLYSEDLNFACIIGDWIGFLITAREYTINQERKMCRSVSLWQSIDLYGDVSKNADILNKEVLESELTIEEKDLLSLYLYFSKNGLQDYIYEKKHKEFKKKYPTSAYSDFVNSYIKPSSKFAMTFGFGTAGIFPIGKMRDYFNPNVVFAMQWDGYFNKFYVGMRFDMGNNMAVQKDMLSTDTRYSKNIYKNHNFSYMDAGFYFGYLVFQNKWFQFSPYIYLGGFVLESLFYKGDNKGDEFQIYDSFFAGPGLRFSFNPFTKNKLHQSLDLRLDVGYDYPVACKYEPARGSVFYANLALVWRIGNF